MAKTITYLEMGSATELRPARPVPGLATREEPAYSPLMRSLCAEIGRAYQWRSAARTPADWDEAALQHPDRRFWLIEQNTTTVGAFAIQPGPAVGDIELTTFGLLPPWVGTGLGGHALTLALTQAWTWKPASRIWLRTTSTDHPHALANYTSRGMRVFHTETTP
ncbi:GNAT family N-acetyltransferase [Actinocorallia lasiicapitis]